MKRLMLLLALCLSLPAFAQYTRSAGTNAPAADIVIETRADPKTGTVRQERIERPVQRDSHGNAASAQHDLAVDGAFDGQTVVVIQLYTGSDHGVPFDFVKPKEALAQKGFSVYRYLNRPPAPKELAEKLQKASQLWVIGGAGRQLTEEHARVIKRFFDSGRGVYLWGDNAPYSDDANIVARALFGTELVEHHAQGEQVVGIHRKGSEPGVIQRHLLTTGIEYLYEGHTITNIDKLGPLEPLIYGSDGRVVGAYYDRDGKRAIIDGGFTRLYLKWDTAGTGRYVMNAAAWLANAERFGDKVVARKVQQQ
ncbi:hypothetical protein [Pyxidicoccus trucidator]|uniref:hypothetical protein n=1 Tax=Pyxidicoccus trucidator TaxID=2709662 RepID=UPI0013DC96FC|nr:hypothetical protein [Pyxidicoccus trucidator]